MNEILALARAKERAQQRAWYQRNKDKVKSSARKWYAANKDKAKSYRLQNKKKRAAQHRDWCKRNPEKIRASQAVWRAKNRDHMRQWYLANKDKVNAAQRRWYQAHREEHLLRCLAKRGNVSVEQYKRMVASQRGKCAICRNVPNGRRRNLFLDHDHRSGKARALLCDPCNKALGFFRDNVKVMKRAIAYIQKHTQAKD